jgi:iron(III) transport system ATP-binding protein
VDDPISLYNRPTSRFVAGFIGRTNFLDGTLDGASIVFPGFTAAAGLFPDTARLSGAASFSVRPQTILLHRTPPADTSKSWWVRGQIIERAYLGEYWDYVVRPENSDLRLRAAAPPLDIHDVGTSVWAEIDPRRIAHIPGPKG